MRKMSWRKRVTSALLALVMVLSWVPVSIFAEDYGTATGTFENTGSSTTEHLFFATDRHTNTSIIGDLINAMESDIGENELDYLGLGGDMVGSGNSHPAYNSSTVLGEITGATTSLNATNVDIVAGIHDMNVTDDSGIVLPYQGGGAQIYAGANYYVYGVEEYCISEDSDEKFWQEQADKFVDWAKTVDSSKVIIVLSHYPLHAKRADNDGAYIWHQALNEVATGSEEGTSVTRDVVFFHGHNHTVDSGEYFYDVGDTMSIQNGSSTVSDTIYYSYATAGYLNQNKSATLLTISDSNITFEKYTNSGSSHSTTGTVTRVVKVPETLEVTGKTTYTVGQTIADPTSVVVNYTDGTEETVTSGWELTSVSPASGVDANNKFLAAGTYNLTYTCTIGTYQADAILEVTVTESSDSGTDTDTDTPEEQEDDWNFELPANQTATGTSGGTEEKTVYVLTTTLTSGKNYLIVDSNSTDGNALMNNSNAVGSTTVTISSGTLTIDGTTSTKTYIELSNSNAVWTAGTSGSNRTFKNGSYYLYHDGGVLSLKTSGDKKNWTWNSSSNCLYYTGGGTTRYLTYDDDWTLTTSAAKVYLYEETTATVSSAISGTYSIAGEDLSVAVAEGSTADLTSTLTFTPESGDPTTTDTSSTATYEIVTEDKDGNAVVGDPNKIISKIENGVVTFTGNHGKALVKVSYTTDFGVVTDYIEIEARAPYYTIELHEIELKEATGVTADNFSAGTYYVYNATTGFYHKATEYVEGTTYYTNEFVQGEEITDTVILKGIEKGEIYAVWAVVKEHTSENPEGVDLGSLGDALTWTVSDESIATINTQTGVLTFTGENYGTFTVTVSYTGDDKKTVTDTITISCTHSLYTVPGDGTDDFPEYPNEGAVRHDKTSTAVGNFSETGVTKVELSMTGVPYTTGSEIDVVVMLDMTGSMSDNGMEAAEEATKAFVEIIVKNTDGSYNDNRVAVYAFNSGSSSPYELVALDTIDSDTELETANTAIDTASDKQASGGTPYEEATQKCHDVLAAAKSTNLPEGVESAEDYDRQQFCVFMSDGGPTTYYGSDEKTYYGGNNNSGDVTIASMMENYTSSTASSWSMNLPTEYYTDDMKADGVTVYTVGLLLQNTPSNPAPWSAMTSVSSVYDSDTDSLTTVGTHYYFTSEILKQMATDESKYIDIFNVDNAANATEKFQAIAQDILAAATDVTVGDKISEDYTMIFDAPNTTVDGADGGQEYYIEIMDYPLVPVYDDDGTTVVDYTRGTGTSLLKLYLGYKDSGYYAATDSTGTAAATPAFEKVTLGDKGTKYYWTTDSSAGDSGVSVTGADGVTYYFVSSGKGTHNMTSGAYASGTKTTETLTHDDNTTSTSTTCQDMIIASPYFVYNAETKMLIWTVEEISASELTLTYFLYLNNSGGFSGTDQETTPDTYTTNQFAYMSYTNFQGTDCQVTFPVPQMTWNGAQVSYVFYLVNEQGQPVNRQGRVVPFSEAVYVTDVFTTEVVWNDLEQAAGLDAEHLAKDLVPDVFALFDDGAQYNIHVYESFEKVNLNNHFMIKSSMNVYTTYVFNTKSDAEKYNIPGVYVANDGDSTDKETNLSYWCKSYDVTGTFEKQEYTDPLYGTYYTYTVTSANYTGTETQVPATSMGSTTGGTEIGGYVYYVDENEKIYTIVSESGGNEVREGFDFSNATVAFAVVWTPGLKEDTVVVDFGLDLKVDVIENDVMIPGVAGISNTAPNGIGQDTQAYDEQKLTGTAIDLKIGDLLIGKATVTDNAHIQISLDKENGMRFSQPVSFYYEAKVEYYDNDELVVRYMYSKVTVIPAATIYYEDEYTTLAYFTSTDDWQSPPVENAGWDTNSTSTSVTQSQDRPGESKLSKDHDADNLYGYDPAYDDCSTFSMGSAAKVTVNAGKYATAVFTFTGTGFDVTSLTSNDTGVMVAQVFDSEGTEVRTIFVDTYWGYKFNDGKWTVTTGEDPTDLYQIPIITATELPYGEYRVVLTASYHEYFNHPKDGSYDLYLDAVRIYDPAGVVSGETNKTVSDAYVADGEMIPTYQELRDNMIGANSLGTNGAVFVDGIPDATTVAEYTTYGPNNELYLASGQAVLFNLTMAGDINALHIGLSSVSGNVEFYIFNADAISDPMDVAKQTKQTLTTATDMYYDITAIKDGTILIYNSGESGILSITTLKILADSPVNVNVTGAVSEAKLYNILMALGGTVMDDPDANPDQDDPSTDEPGTDAPGTDDPGTDEPGTDDPGTDEPGTDDPGTDAPGTDAPGTDEPGTDNPGTDDPSQDEPGADEPTDSTNPGATAPNGGTTDGDSGETNKTVLIVAIAGGAALLMASIIVLLKKLLGGR